MAPKKVSIKKEKKLKIQASLVLEGRVIIVKRSVDGTISETEIDGTRLLRSLLVSLTKD